MDDLEKSASDYYRTNNLLPVAGSQAAIQVLSRLTENCRVAILSPTYSEYANAWGFVDKNKSQTVYSAPPRHRAEIISLKNLEKTLELFDMVVDVNPNNPTGAILSREKLLEWRERLAVSSKMTGSEKWLIIDEAFMDSTHKDSTKEESLVSEVGKPGLIVLRSLGKYFGLSGARVGFVFGWPELLSSIREIIGPWSLTGPSRFLATQVLQDEKWQEQTRQKLFERRDCLKELLSRHGLTPSGEATLFQWVKVRRSKELFNTFAKQGILVRHFPQLSGLRFGLPGAAPQLLRLEEAISKADIMK